MLFIVINILLHYGFQSTKFVSEITNPHPDAFYTPIVRSLALTETLLALMNYYQHLAGGQVRISCTGFCRVDIVRQHFL